MIRGLLFGLLVASLSASASPSKPPIRIVALGDSLTAGYGVVETEAFPVLLQEKLRKESGFKDLVVVNAGISGSTSASAANRLKWLLKTPTDIVLIALGANDGLRGTQPQETKKNLANAIEMVQAAHAIAVLAGMKMPPNYGKEYLKEYEAIFPDLSKKYRIALVPFLLEGVAADKALNQADGIHPNAAGHKIVAENVFKVLLPVVEMLKSKGARP